MPFRRTLYTPTNGPLLALGTIPCILVSAFFLAGGFKYGFIKHGFVSLFFPVLGLPTFLITFRWPGLGSLAMWIMVCCCIAVTQFGGILGLDIIPIGFLVISSMIASVVYRNSRPTATTIIR